MVPLVGIGDVPLFLGGCVVVVSAGMVLWFWLESLILAQDERWRRA